MAESADSLETIPAIAARLLGDEVAAVEPIGGGGNSRVYRVVDRRQRAYALKAYYARSDNRDCLTAEFDALRLLWRQGIHNVPQPLAADPAAGYALYGYVEGRKLPASEITTADIDAAVAFLGRLKQLARQCSDENLRPAAEACFSGNQLLENLQGRLDRLMKRPSGEPADASLVQFIEGEFLPTLKTLSARGRQQAWFAEELPPAARTLSPSDFGFHNAIRRIDGQWIFFDFEYFGWDDPAKTLSDFLLHPAMDLPAAHQRRFASGLAAALDADGSMRTRVPYLYPLFGLKWCLILLNEFLPEHFRRRQFAAQRATDRRAVEQTQLAKARRMLQRVLEQHTGSDMAIAIQ